MICCEDQLNILSKNCRNLYFKKIISEKYRLFTDLLLRFVCFLSYEYDYMITKARNDSHH